MNNSWVMEEVINCLTTAAPQLRELTLGIIQPELDVDALATPFDSSAPALRTIDSRRWSALFGGHTPALRTFCLSSVCDVLSILEDPPSGMTALHTLVLHGTLRRASYATQVRSRMSHGSWHGFLARVRNLRTLRLVEFTAQNVQECVTALSRSLEGEPGPSLTRLEIIRPGGGFDKPLRDAVEMAVRSVSGRGKLETLVVVPGEEESSSAADWEGLREFCTVKIGEDDGA
ncbi:hypothetical protein EVJ58_g9180 [Rhodofomes roseus]|uniref:Uncharacterized protein n=1 Tax=Rhodofomes roseus TaxID=34475 RepID=A0A4Y9XZ71_9APHY|nr:hypothetical protein EVJ58_g9180 [Rhodofomes roseus]